MQICKNLGPNPTLALPKIPGMPADYPINPWWLSIVSKPQLPPMDTLKCPLGSVQTIVEFISVAGEIQ